MSKIEERTTTTFIFIIQKYPGARCDSWQVPSWGPVCVQTRSDTYLNVTASVPIRAPTPLSVWAVKQAFALLDSPVGDEYNYTSRTGTRKPLPIYYGPGSLDAQWCNCRQRSSQPSISSAKYSNLTPAQARRGGKPKSKLSITTNAPDDGVETHSSSPDGGVETQTSPVPCGSQSVAAHLGGADGGVETHSCSVETSSDSQSFAAHYGTLNSFWNQWPAGAEQASGAYSA
ncbi:hypothetical protein K435DRAFT_847671 [Dendrothele bispora CBS 962.96]|uniref:Uncharacterized protein n=1 Tax=Dendrothele bispora (strain CBS 962.96) TaxID=1314807 RepID=A0A4S8MWX7_DENBC|nr:hypothetical protein K435DRAFT_847671 [Dendrothele bispora CBS 962.96]